MLNTTTRSIGLLSFALFVATVFLANWLVEEYGVVDLLGFQAPAAVFAVGLAFTFRDLVHRTLGPHYAIAAILIGTVLSFIISPVFAFASGVAFLVSELVDLGIFVALEKHFLAAVALSNVVGLAVDSVIFLLLAFGSLEFLPGQIIGKLLMTAAALPFVLVLRRALLPRYA